MAFLSNPVITIDGEDYTGYCTAITITAEKEALEDTVFGMTAREYEAGLESNSAEITLFMDYTALGAWTLLNALYRHKVYCQSKAIVRRCQCNQSRTNPHEYLHGQPRSDLRIIGRTPVNNDVNIRRIVYYKYNTIITGILGPTQGAKSENQTICRHA
jgi:hypothetical protein